MYVICGPYVKIDTRSCYIHLSLVNIVVLMSLIIVRCPQPDVVVTAIESLRISFTSSLSYSLLTFVYKCVLIISYMREFILVCLRIGLFYVDMYTNLSNASQLIVMLISGIQSSQKSPLFLFVSRIFC